MRITVAGLIADESVLVNIVTDISKLRRIKLVHTIIWAILAAGILALPWIGWTRQFTLALAVTLFVMAEAFVLLRNHCRCPLTTIAGQYTSNRADNFDIYLPAWLARYNKLVFGCAFGIGEVVVLTRLLNK